MSTKLSLALRFMFSFFGIMMFCQSSFADENRPLTKEQVLALLPMGVDMLDPTVVSNYQILVESGPRAYLALTEVLNDTDNPIVIGRIFAVFVESKGDKIVAINAVNSTIRKYHGKNTPEAAKVRIYAAQTLGEIGKPDDISALYEMVNDNDERVRVNAIRALAKAGDEKALAVIEKFISARKTNTSQDAIQKDTSFRESNKAVEMIRKKLNETKNPIMSK